MISFTFLALVFGASFAPFAYGADSVAYNDSSIQFQGQRDTSLGINVGFVFPPANEVFNPPEFIIQIRSTDATSKWIGIAMFGNMLNCLLLVAWPNPAGNNVVFSPRYTSYVLIFS
jgi:cellobiose dehydrogenase (acceptor)